MLRLLTLLLALAVAGTGSRSVEARPVHVQPEDSPFTLTWQRLVPTVSPPARYGAGMAYDGATGTLLLFGGNDGVRSLGDTWRWDGWTWTELRPATSPPARESPAIASYPDSGRIVLFGGRGVEGAETVLLDDTWILTGTPRANAPVSPAR